MTTPRRGDRAAAILAERLAIREADAREYAEAIGERKITTLDDIQGREKPDWITKLLTQGLHGLAGPPEAGKSLVCRNWEVEVAAGEQHALYAMSEGYHDVEDRFTAHPLLADASTENRVRKFLHFLEVPISLASPEDVSWLIAQFPSGLALAVFDMVYGFGLPDDSGVRDVAPVIKGGKRIAQEMGCAVVFTGHPGHNGERRFRGSSMWRGSFDAEFHMAEGRFTCEKHKYADKRNLSWNYQVEYPLISAVGASARIDQVSKRYTIIARSFRDEPGLSQRARAKELYGELGVSEARAKFLIVQQSKLMRAEVDG